MPMSSGTGMSNWKRLHRIKVDLQKKEDAFLERLLDETITREVYEAKFTALEQERGRLDAAILSHEQANRSHWCPQQDDAQTL
jgi:hypothetical protein